MSRRIDIILVIYRQVFSQVPSTPLIHHTNLSCQELLQRTDPYNPSPPSASHSVRRSPSNRNPSNVCRVRPPSPNKALSDSHGRVDIRFHPSAPKYRCPQNKTKVNGCWGVDHALLRCVGRRDRTCPVERNLLYFRRYFAAPVPHQRKLSDRFPPTVLTPC
jgi:hypothetical protein